jgi:hypothetical protein
VIIEWNPRRERWASIQAQIYAERARSPAVSIRVDILDDGVDEAPLQADLVGLADDLGDFSLRGVVRAPHLTGERPRIQVRLPTRYLPTGLRSATNLNIEGPLLGRRPSPSLR